MTVVADQGVPATHHELRQRLRAAILGPRGGGTSRRRASDAFRLVLAVAVVAVAIPVIRSNSAVELTIVQALNPPPAPVRWLVTSVFWLGSAGVVALLVVVGRLLVPRLVAIRWTALAAAATWGLCALLGALLGSATGRPAISALAGLNAGYPVTRLAVTMAVAGVAMPYLSRPVHRLVSFLVAAAVLAAVCGLEVGVRDFRPASTSASPTQLNRHLAAALGAMAVQVGAERTAAAHRRGNSPGSGDGGAHPAAVHGLPAADLGLADLDLDAPPQKYG